MNQNQRKMAAKESEKLEQVAKYTAKDSVFTDLFQEPKYLLQLYQALHPEDKEATEDSISNVTITNILLDQWYNDIGFQVGKKLIALVECQSSWTMNIIVRCLLYLAQTYQEYIENTKQNVYGSKKLELPRPELYVVYIGERKRKPEYLSLSQEFFNGLESSVEVKVKMIYDGKEGDIINQYIRFTKIYNEQVKLYGRSREAILETIHICKDSNILKEYLEGKEKEVIDIMMMLFNKEYILKTYIESEKREAAEKAAEKAAKKATERATKEAEEKMKLSAQRLYQKGVSIEDIAESLEISKEDVEQWIELVEI